jgi:hypothetical protein
VSFQRNGLNFLNGSSQIVLMPTSFRGRLVRRINLRTSASCKFSIHPSKIIFKFMQCSIEITLCHKKKK